MVERVEKKTEWPSRTFGPSFGAQTTRFLLVTNPRTKFQLYAAAAAAARRIIMCSVRKEWMNPTLHALCNNHFYPQVAGVIVIVLYNLCTGYRMTR